MAQEKETELKEEGLGVMYKIPLSMYAKHRAKVMERMAALGVSKKAAVVLEGGKQKYQYDTDIEILFRQESHFMYLFGINEPGCFGVLDLERKESLLFVPERGPDFELWCGKPDSKQGIKKKYGVDHVFYVDELPVVLAERGLEVLHVLKGANKDSGLEANGASFKGDEKFKKEGKNLLVEMAEARLIKTEEELEVMRFIGRISSEAHCEVIRQVARGRCQFEFQLETEFKHYTGMKAGSRYVAYCCICCSGEQGAILHYGHAGKPNAEEFHKGQMLLLDMGAEYHGYASDITCSYPVGGKFTQDQREVYTAVLEGQRAAYRVIKPGIKWSDVHRAAERGILEQLVKFEFILPKGKTLDELHKLHLPAVFMPHGLGHLIGLDTHDVGGYPEGVERIDEPGVRNLRCGRVLQKGMVLSNEPGVYFINAFLERAFADEKQAPHLNKEKLARFRKFGGVRLEDNFVVTEDGYENLTHCPREIAEVEAMMAAAYAEVRPKTEEEEKKE